MKEDKEGKARDTKEAGDAVKEEASDFLKGRGREVSILFEITTFLIRKPLNHVTVIAKNS